MSSEHQLSLKSFFFSFSLQRTGNLEVPYVLHMVARTIKVWHVKDLCRAGGGEA